MHSYRTSVHGAEAIRYAYTRRASYIVRAPPECTALCAQVNINNRARRRERNSVAGDGVIFLGARRCGVTPAAARGSRRKHKGMMMMTFRWGVSRPCARVGRQSESPVSLKRESRRVARARVCRYISREKETCSPKVLFSAARGGAALRDDEASRVEADGVDARGRHEEVGIGEARLDARAL